MSSTLGVSELCEECRQVREVLRIDILRLFQDLSAVEPPKVFNEVQKKIVCKSFQGYQPQEIAQQITDARYHENRNAVTFFLTVHIYPRISTLLEESQVPDVNEKIAGKWARIINYLLKLGYRLGDLCPIPIVNTLMSFGNYIFLRRRHPDISRFQLSAARDYSEGDYYSALAKFLTAWNEEKDINGKGNPETLIYISNSLLERNRESLSQRGIIIYTIAVVVPIEHNEGKVAAELLFGVAQIQLQRNLDSLESHQIDRTGCNDLKRVIGINSSLFDQDNFNRNIVLRVLIVDESQSLQYDGNVNQAAEDLVRRADELEIRAVLGHYASEMTRSAVSVYTNPRTKLFCITPSSTSDELSDLEERVSFFRMTTQDFVAAARLANYLASIPQAPQNVAIIYNQNSSYCQSFKNAICQHLQQNPEKFNLLPESGNLSNGYFQSIKPYLDKITALGVTTIIIIADGGIEPRSLNDAQAIGQFKMNSCLIAGSATFYQDNVLDWVQQNVQHGLLDINDASNLVACVPWHYHSVRNGCNSSNTTAVEFCQLGDILWGEGKLTWRSATCYDAVLTIIKSLPINHEPLARRIDFTEVRIRLRNRINDRVRGLEGNQVGINGVTGEIKFDSRGNRINPPTEIVAVRFNSEKQRYEFIPVELLKDNDRKLRRNCHG